MKRDFNFCRPTEFCRLNSREESVGTKCQCKMPTNRDEWRCQSRHIPQMHFLKKLSEAPRSVSVFNKNAIERKEKAMKKNSTDDLECKSSLSQVTKAFLKSFLGRALLEKSFDIRFPSQGIIYKFRSVTLHHIIFLLSNWFWTFFI